MTNDAHDSRLRHFPITLLPSVMGLAGLAIVYLKFQHVFAVDLPVGQAILYGTSAWFVFVMATYGLKLLKYPDEVKRDFLHPIRINFFAAISICFLLLSIGYLESGYPAVARVLWLIGTPLIIARSFETCPQAEIRYSTPQTIGQSPFIRLRQNTL